MKFPFLRNNNLSLITPFEIRLRWEEALGIRN